MSEIKRDPDYPSLQETMGWNDEEYDSLFDASAKRNRKILQGQLIKERKLRQFYKKERIKQGIRDDEYVKIDSKNNPFEDFDKFCRETVLEEDATDQ